jgi:hypothetical protein
MTSIQELEIGRYYDQLKDDVNDLVDKYLRIADWDIPDNNEKQTVALVIRALRKALEEVESEWQRK